MRTSLRSSIASSGFTLTEIVGGIAVLAILVSVAAPSMSNLILDSRVKEASLDMFSAMAYARSEAISRNAPVSISAVGTWAQGWRVSIATTVLRQGGPLLNITVVGPAGGSITYNPNGRPAGNIPVTFSFSVPGNPAVTMRCVTATLGGQPVLQNDRNRDGDCANG
jgi:type IV fimbrial biogenesis protein FimT